MSNTSPPKTYKREVALALIGFLIAMGLLTAGAAMFVGAAQAEVLSGLTIGLSIPILGFAAMAFGMDWHAKQNKVPLP
jgi:uncharacterized YccA/Bax inhibitor family protein